MERNIMQQITNVNEAEEVDDSGDNLVKRIERIERILAYMTAILKESDTADK